MMNEGVKSGHLYLVLAGSGKVFSISPSSIMSVVGFLYRASVWLRCVPSVPGWLKSLS